MKKVTFSLVEDANRVTTVVPETGEHLVIEGDYETNDAHEIAALDASPGVERASSKPKTEKPEPKGDA